MKFYQILVVGIIALSLIGCQQMQQQQVQQNSGAQAGQRMQAAMHECSKEKLTRKNAVTQIDCIGRAKREAGHEINNPFMWNLEQDIAADRESAVEYSEGKISKQAYIAALDKHWADTLAADARARAQSRQEELEENIQTMQVLQSLQPAPAVIPDHIYVVPVSPEVAPYMR